MKQKINDKLALNIVYLEDSHKDVEIIRELLIDAGYDLQMDLTDKKDEFICLLKNKKYDCILSDFMLPGFNAFGALEIALEICPETPFIVISGSIGEDIAIELIKKGAVDYVLKDRLVRLPSAIKRALDEVIEIELRLKTEKELRERECQLHDIIDNAPFGAFIYELMPDNRLVFVDSNHEADLITGVNCKKFIGKTIEEAFPPLAKTEVPDAYRNAARTGERYDSEQVDYDYDLIKGAYEVHAFRIQTNKVCIFFRDITERKKAETKLKEQETQYRNLANTGLALIWTSGVDKLCNYFNEPWLKFTGRTLEQELGNGWAEGVHPEDFSKCLEIYNLAFDNRVPFEMDYRLKHASGEYRWIKDMGTPNYNSNGEFIGYIGHCFDITENVAAKQKIQNSENELNILFAQMTNGFAVHEIICDENNKPIDYKFLKINKAFENLTGLKAENIIGKTVLEVMPNTEKIFIEKYGEVSLTGKDVKFEMYSGELKRYFNIVAYSPEPKKFATIFEDITDKKIAEENINLLYAKYKTLFDNLPLGISVSDNTGRIIETNPIAEKLLGISKEEHTSRTINSKEWKLINLDGSPLYPKDYPSVKALAENKLVQNVKMGVVKPDNNVTWINVTATPLPIKNGGVIIAYNDITDNILAEEKIRQAQKFESLGTLAGGIAHDFNNILGIILAYATNLSRIVNDKEKLDKATDTIMRAVQRGKTLVQQILTFARKTEIKFVPINVNDIVIEIMGMIYETFPKTFNYRQNINKDIPLINADRSQIHQAILNLCVNARDAMPSGGGSITISTGIIDGNVLKKKFLDATENKYVMIEIVDTGIGMTDEVKKHIFEPFYTTKEIGKGTGLGLSVVLGIMQTHKGFIDVESELNKGTTFTIYFPSVEGQQILEQNLAKDEIQNIKGGNETILLIEDEPALLIPLQMMLEEKGYNIITASDGEEALQVYNEKSKKISLIISDLGLPKITGVDVCKNIKKINPKQKIILATGYLAPDVKAEVNSIGIHNILYKPYEVISVIKLVRKILDEKKG